MWEKHCPLFKFKEKGESVPRSRKRGGQWFHCLRSQTREWDVASLPSVSLTLSHSYCADAFLE